MNPRPLQFVELNCFVDKPVEIVTTDRQILIGKVRFVGLTDLSDEYWVGLELPHPTGTTNGKAKGKEYFRTKPKHGLFVELPTIRTCVECPAQTFLEEQQQYQMAQRNKKPQHPSSTMLFQSDLLHKTVTVERESGALDKGVVRFHGKTHFANGIWVGVELFEPTGRNNGTVAGVPYFKCQQGHGVFVKEDLVTERVEENFTFERTAPRGMLAVRQSEGDGNPNPNPNPSGNDGPPRPRGEPRSIRGGSRSPKNGGGGGPGSPGIQDPDAGPGPGFVLGKTPPPNIEDRAMGGIPIIDNPIQSHSRHNDGQGGSGPLRTPEGDALTPIVNRDVDGAPIGPRPGPRIGLGYPDTQQHQNSRSRKQQGRHGYGYNQPKRGQQRQRHPDRHFGTNNDSDCDEDDDGENLTPPSAALQKLEGTLSPSDRRQIVRALDENVKAQV